MLISGRCHAYDKCFSFGSAVQLQVDPLDIKLNFNLIAHTTRLLIELLLANKKRKVMPKKNICTYILCPLTRALTRYKDEQEVVVAVSNHIAQYLYLFAHKYL